MITHKERLFKTLLKYIRYLNKIQRLRLDSIRKILFNHIV